MVADLFSASPQGYLFHISLLITFSIHVGYWHQGGACPSMEEINSQGQAAGYLGSLMLEFCCFLPRPE
jgi:hypothetical protein